MVVTMAMMALLTFIPRLPPESQVYEVKKIPPRPGGGDPKELDRLRLIVDSGAHSGCLSSNKLHLYKSLMPIQPVESRSLMERC